VQTIKNDHQYFNRIISHEKINITFIMSYRWVNFISFVTRKRKTDLEKGVNFIETIIYSDEENTEILKLYNDLRVADVSDGMDMVGLPGTGLVDPGIHADWIDLEQLFLLIGKIRVLRY